MAGTFGYCERIHIVHVYIYIIYTYVYCIYPYTWQYIHLCTYIAGIQVAYTANWELKCYQTHRNDNQKVPAATWKFAEKDVSGRWCIFSLFITLTGYPNCCRKWIIPYLSLVTPTFFHLGWFGGFTSGCHVYPSKGALVAETPDFLHPIFTTKTIGGWILLGSPKLCWRIQSTPKLICTMLERSVNDHLNKHPDEEI